MYAVPGLKSHVFVGPFAAPKTFNDDDDIVCLEDDDVKIVEPNKDEDEAEKKEVERKKEMSIKRKLLGQLPTVVDKDETEEDVDIVEEQD